MLARSWRQCAFALREAGTYPIKKVGIPRLKRHSLCVTIDHPPTDVIN